MGDYGLCSFDKSFNFPGGVLEVTSRNNIELSCATISIETRLETLDEARLTIKESLGLYEGTIEKESDIYNSFGVLVAKIVTNS